MTRSERIELLVIGVVAATGWLAQPYFPTTIPLWQIVLGLSALLLAQSLVRDVAILFRRGSAPNAPRREAQCFCLESSVGTTGIVFAAILGLLASAKQVAVGRWEFVVMVAGTLALGFIMKDLVISWNPLGLRREKDHLNLIVRWKPKPK